MLNRIVTLLYEKGYRPFREQDGSVLIRDAGDVIYVVALSTFRQDVTSQRYQDADARVVFNVSAQYHKTVKILNLVAVENGMFEEPAMQFVEQLDNVWFVAKDTGKIYVFENQPQQFDDLYTYIEQGIYRKRTSNTAFSPTPVNLTIVALNVLYFIAIVVINGSYSAIYDSDIMLRMGALDYESFISGKWYEIITSLFMHFGIGHLFNNMLLLVYAGCQLEKIIGKIPYFILYIASGICGNVVSLWYYHSIGEYAVSAGASGAIFGVIGALLVVLFINRTKTAETTPKRLLFLAFITIYYGMTTIGVDNAAHIGGFICGIIGGFLLSKVSQYGKLEEVS